MAQLAISAAGAVIGFYVGGPVGAQVGWAAGSLLGAQFGPSQQGPRLSDATVQVSSYGGALPITYGGVQVSGNVIWSTDLIEAETGGGKGGPSVTNYSYSVSCAVAIGEGPIGGVRKIWADAKLVYDISTGADSSAKIGSSHFSTYMTLYLGTEDQMPDPTIEASEGAGNVEAYRGTAYLVLTDLPLAEFGNRLPLFRFETTTDGAESEEVVDLQPLKIYPWTLTSDGRPIHSLGDTNYSVQDGGYVADFTSYSAAVADRLLNLEHGGSISDTFFAYSDSTNGLASVFSGGADLSGDPQTVTYKLGSELFQVVCPDPDRNDIAGFNYGTWGDSMKQAGVIPGDTRSCWSIDNESVIGTEYMTRVQADYSARGGYATVNAYIYTSNPANWSVTLGSPTEYLAVTRLPTVPPSTCEVGDPAVLGMAQIPGDENWCISSSGEISPNLHYEIVSGTYKQLAAIEYRAGALYQNGLGPVLAPSDPNYSNSAYWSALTAAAITAGDLEADVTSPAVVTQVALATTQTAEVAEGSILLSEIVADICARAGLDSGQIDVTALTDEVQGYRIAGQMPARAAIDPLRQAFYFDGVENGDQIVFVKRGGSAVATITADDLGAGEGDAETALVVPVRGQETELPAEVRVAYMVREADYQTGTQQSIRVTTGSQQKTGVELPIVMTDQKAAEVADVLMYDAWVGRVQRKFSTTRKFTKYLPTDVATVNDGEFTYTGVIAEKMEDGPVIRWTMRDTDPASYSPNSTPGAVSGGGGAVTYDGPMRLHLMDLPALRDDDDDPGFYAAANGYLSGFRGGVLYQSLDDTDYTSLLSMNAKATIGYVDGVLGDFAGGNVVDETHIVSVVLYSGTLSSVTRAQLLSGQNVALLGDEVLSFQRAVLTAPNTYSLSGLLRGRRGTEQHMGSHADEERFVLLNAATVYRVPQSLIQVGEAFYKPVTYGQAVDATPSQEFENTAAALWPLSPVHLNANSDGLGGYDVQWVRRTRIGGAWLDNIDAPLSEAVEQYRVRVLSAGIVTQEQTVSAQSANVTASPGDVVEVAQLSVNVGAGFAATFTLT